MMEGLGKYVFTNMHILKKNFIKIQWIFYNLLIT